ncbi:hypothetical protein PRZ48_007400 [Zasmidium cellare]|uniref:C2H2-type domain-containing protein n=1 Tax=Zasmidium cellare TaxID=395010 RepID=A0ABR0EKB2_ZASCE|nr:hypothetical protein PRZ48_007400 [Zasmidium cellare]
MPDFDCMMAPPISTRRSRTSHKSTLPAAAFEALTPAERRSVHAVINRSNPCNDCDFVGPSGRDLKRHYDKRAGHGYIPNGPKAECFACEKSFCTKQALDGHHSVVHMFNGPFAKMRDRSAASAPQTQTQNTSTDAMQPAQTASISFTGPAIVPDFTAGAHPTHPARGFHPDSPHDLPPPLPDMLHAEEMDATPGLFEEVSLNSRLLERSQSLRSVLFDSAIDSPQETIEEVQPAGDVNDHSGAQTTQISETETRSTAAVGLELLAQVMAAGELDEARTPHTEEEAPEGYHSAAQPTSSRYSGREESANTAQQYREEQGDPPEQNQTPFNQHWDAFGSSNTPDVTSDGRTPAEWSEATAPYDFAPEALHTHMDNLNIWEKCTCVGPDHFETCFFYQPFW